MFVFAEFVKIALPTAVGILPFVMAFVTYWGKLGVTGNWQLISSMLTGLVLGGVVMYAQTFPVTFVEWLSVGLFGVIVGLAASGVYEVGKDLVQKN